MAARRSYGTGSLSERPAGSGRLFFRYSLPQDPMTGQRRRGVVTIEAKNKSAARVKANKILATLEAQAGGSEATLNELLTEWMHFQSRRGRSPTTLAGYQSIIDHYLEPTLGSMKIRDLTPHLLDTLYGRCSADGKSPRTIRNIHNVLSAALNQAVRWGWLDKNPALLATLPEAAPLKMEAPSPDQAQALISACQEHDEVLGAFVFLAAVTGCRRGEVAARRWSSIQNGTLLVRESVYSVKGDAGLKATKSGRERVVHLDPVVQSWLASWERRCRQVAADWDVQLHSDSFIVSSRPDGSAFVHLNKMAHDVSRIANRLGLKSIHLHSLRHFAATELLAAGISARDAAEMLGHADPSLTLRVYAHATAERQVAAAAVLASALTPPEALAGR